MKISDTRIISNYTVYKKHLNRHNTLFGGQILFWLDEVMGMTIRKYSKTLFVTASIDTYQFIEPVQDNELLKIESYVTRVGNKSVEVFGEVTAYNTEERKNRLVGISFATFSIRKDIKEFSKLEDVEYETKLEKFVCETYNDRKENKVSIREFTKNYIEKFNEYYRG
ncbi:acyl-CoA thioesterase [Gemella sp. zg-570]|uniref:acyl-CoA thioesterase n=1 Tax=Gemella sp. zg-570 TaxID=2840371 RepID=UPI001C0C6209|nr:acyl-CoA thioesterase [Gemella sp. zg-570]QWQ38171.1 acyl-CoA thioesterase [Gemella sp. zg-570]